MKINLEDLRGLPQQRMFFAFKENLDGLDAVKPVIGDLTVTLGSWGVYVTGRVQTLLRLTCHRCLGSYFQSLNVDIDERFVEAINVTSRGKERELTKDDFVEPIPDDGVLDISDVVYQAVTLATPTYCLCGIECPGPPVASTAGHEASLGSDKHLNPQIDPRWKNLKTLFPNEGSEEKS